MWPADLVRVAAAEGEQPQEVRLARPVRSQHADAFAEPHLQVERRHQPGELELRAHQGAAAGARPLQPHRQVLLERTRLRRPGLLELAQAGHGGAVPRGEGVVRLRLDLQRRDQLLQLRVLLVPAPLQFVEAVHAVAPRLVIRAEAAAVGPGRVSGAAELDRDEPVGDLRQQLAIVADQQHGLLRRAQLALEPALRGHVEVVVGLVEQQHLVGAAQQRLERQPLLLAAAQARHVAVLRALERDAERRDRALVPEGLLLVAAGVRVVGDRRRVRHLIRRGVLVDEGVLGGVEGEARPRARRAARPRSEDRAPSSRRAGGRRTGP